MKKISYYIICVLLGSIALSCEDQWDKRIESEGDSGVVSNLSVLEYIKTSSEYAKFDTLLKRVGVDSLLQQGMQYTVWLPSAESLVDVDALSDSLAKHFVMNHITLTSTFASVFEPEMSVKLVSGKRVRMRADTDSPTGYRLQNAGVKRSNLICKDGVIHELDTCLIPALNLYEKLESDDYSLLLNWLKRFDRSVFDEENSTHTGYDEWDNPIYDSLFITENEILENGDIRDEDLSFTIFATPDLALETRMEKLISDFTLMNNGVAPTPEEQRGFEDWLVKSLVYNGEIKDYETQDDLYSVHGELWRCSKQTGVNDSYMECSNGLFYEVEALYFPTKLLMQPISNHVNFLIENKKAKPQLTTAMTNKGTGGKIQIVSKKIGGETINQFNVIAGLDDEGNQIYDFAFYLFWDSYQILESTSGLMDSIAPAPVMPGEYEVIASYVRYSSFAEEDIMVYVNGQKVGEMTGIKDKNQPAKHGPFSIGIVTIPDSQGVNPVEFKFETIPVTDTRITQYLSPYHIELVPTDNNY